MTLQLIPIDWKHHWLGGFCPVGIMGGLPVRGANYAAHPPLAEMLTLNHTVPHENVNYEALINVWKTTLGGANVLLFRNPDLARKSLLRAVGIHRNDYVALPANSTRDLAESVKHYGAISRFLELDTQLDFSADAHQLEGVRFAFAESIYGMRLTPCLGEIPVCVDYADSLPQPSIEHLEFLITFATFRLR